MEIKPRKNKVNMISGNDQQKIIAVSSYRGPMGFRAQNSRLMTEDHNEIAGFPLSWSD